tara:strand:- start:38 stop:235 length:198 start_codon:yes stop_codon:yes gene_type:complete
MKNLLDAIGSFFVYTSPEPFDGYARFLKGLSSKRLRGLAGTPSHYSKTILINMIVDEMKDNERNT